MRVKMNQSMHNKQPNHLSGQTSPYLLQHLYNPVDWYPWSDEALEKARTENKLIIVSIGYSACHWCHVMEHECFEDAEVAKIMNEHYVCIKVDREERPDIDHIYMSASYIVNNSGGWPLNCFALPDGRPVYAGTYSPKTQWINLLQNIYQTYEKEQAHTIEIAESIKKGIAGTFNIAAKSNKAQHTFDDLHLIYEKISQNFDDINGGLGFKPKFPMPSVYEFLMQYHYQTKNEACLNHILKTLQNMANGGIYDHFGGGFARYSVDEKWLEPHFEKMLYDNAQLVSLYCSAYHLSKNDKFKSVVFETLDFIEQELTAPDGGLYSSIDADSGGEEGAFYIWTKEEIYDWLGGHYSETFCDYYNINDHGDFHGKCIPHITKPLDDIAIKHRLSIDEVKDIIVYGKDKLFIVKAMRQRPACDTKMITSWNALVIKAYIDAYNTFGEERFLSAALRIARFIEKYMMNADFRLHHSYADRQLNELGFLDDYSFTIEAYLAIYQTIFDDKWLDIAQNLADYAIAHFYDNQSGKFYYTSDVDNKLIARPVEMSDNVIPSSSSSMAKALFLLGTIFYDKDYSDISQRMLNNTKENILKSPDYNSNWAILLYKIIISPQEIAIVGKHAIKLRKEFAKLYLPGAIYVGSVEKNDLPILANRYVDGSTKIYVCKNHVCETPVEKVYEALKLL